jgi:hypothetical protein
MTSHEPELITVFDLSSTEGLANLRKFFNLRSVINILTKFHEFVDEFDQDNYQDSFRIRVVSCWGEVYDNEDEYKKLMTCCGQTDRIVTIDSIENIVFEFGCNYGH